jgi:arabinofuranosyltransferase
VHRIGPVLLALALLAWATVAVRCAWMSDDAFITMRHLEHLCAGYGLRYNVAERVQAFTHPLWALLLLPGHALFRDPYYPPLFLSLLTGTAAVALAAVRAAPSRLAGAALVVVLTGSKAVVDFTTSGLENPLTHLLVAAFAVEFLHKKRLPLLALLAGLAMTNRLDTALLVGPALAYALFCDRRQWLLAVAAGATPLALWHSFALVYYGFPFPNTAYAKLGAGIPRMELLESGGAWLDWAIRTDPTTVVLLAIGLVAARTAPMRALATGPLLYVLYVVAIGGDFMGDRFLSAPAVMLAIPLAHLPRPFLAAATALCFLTSVVNPYSPWRSGADYIKAPPSNGVVDERGYYWHGAGWLSSAPGTRPVHRFAKTGARVGKRGQDHVLKATAGFVGYYAGPETHVVDPLGLTDPLLARLPAEFDPDWRVGHFRRFVPAGYVHTAGTDAVDLHDPDLDRYYAALRTVTQGPLFTTERWSAIFALNTGQLDSLIDTDHYRYPHLRAVDALPVRASVGGVALQVSGPMHVSLGQVPGARRLSPWTVRFDDGGTPLKTLRLPPGEHTLTPPKHARRLLLFPTAPARVGLPETP